ncbi:S1 family peptidase [Streptomyces sp. ACA25]|uniref:S1 family peptidase n=1 Tax=Streptomyces sp. ACA25 TaxID=3022596 RepID=UPI002307A25F|nr:S1 family peptidase [Streptomyces sp. ACA25]MDB1088100.1 S1 family peptidase [Streptomyces sp. ACA25]
MSTSRITARTGVARRLRTAAAAVGLLALLAAFAPNAVAAESDQTFSASQLKTASDAVLDADVAGTAWNIDEESGQVTVLADERVSKADIAKIRSTAGSLSRAITVERVDGEFTKLMRGGDAIYADLGWRCSLGFNVRSGSTHFFLTAGHCTEDPYGPTPPYPHWHNGSAWIGTTEHSYFPVRDHGLVRYNPQVSHPSAVNLYSGTRAITSVGAASVGQAICRSGSTTGQRCGTVTALNQSVNYGGGDIVHGLIRTNACAEGGDSGGPMYAGNVGLGMTSGGSGNCSVGGTTFFEPLPRAMTYYGVVLNT